MESFGDCVEHARERYGSNMLQLCPRGYCTAKQKFAVFPSAYANGYAAQVCTGQRPDALGKRSADRRYARAGRKRGKGRNERRRRGGGGGGLARWFGEGWVNVCEPRGGAPGGYAPCGSGAGVGRPERYPYCRPLRRLPGTSAVTVGELTRGEIETMCREKRSRKQGIGGRPTRVALPAATRERVRRSRRVSSSRRPPRGGGNGTQGGGGRDGPPYAWLSLAAVEAHVPEARRLGVSKVARSSRGFVAAYRRHRSPGAMRGAAVPGFGGTWGRRRENFIKRHLAQYRGSPTPRRRLALLMWAFEPDR